MAIPVRRASVLVLAIFVTFTFPARAGDTDAPPPPIVISAPVAAPSDLPPESGTTQKLIGLALGEVGLAGLIAGTFFGLRASASWSEAHDACPGSANCPNHALALSDHDRAVTFATASTISVLVGAAGLTAGALVFWGASGSGAPRATVSLSPAIAAGAGGLIVNGAF